MIEVQFLIRSASLLFAEMEETDVSFNMSGSLKRLLTVLPHFRSIAAIPVHDTGRTVLFRQKGN